MRKTGKILLTEISADKNREEGLIKYQRLLAASFTNYATIKLSMNLFTMYEMSEDISLERRDEIEGYIDSINSALRSIYIDKAKVEDSTVDEITAIRDAITAKMKTLTYFTDALEVYEYILNRKEPEILGTVDEDFSVEELVNSMFEYVFSDDDTMLINSRIKDFTAQLPVRMTREHFFNIIESTMNLYRGSEKSSVNDFIESIRDSALLNVPKDVETAYPELFELYKKVSEADYSKIDKASFDELTGCIDKASMMIQSAVTDYLMLTEIINDVLIVLYTSNIADKAFLKDEYETASQILSEIISADDIYQASESFDQLFVKLEGTQESSYEDLAFLAGNMEDLYETYYEMYDSESIKDNFDKLMKADRLTSSSLFMDINDAGIKVVIDEADDIFIKEETDDLLDDLKGVFKEKSKLERRSIMAKILSQIPVFFNTREEIRDYFAYALSSCTDKSELTACRELINDLMV